MILYNHNIHKYNIYQHNLRIKKDTFEISHAGLILVNSK